MTLIHVFSIFGTAKSFFDGQFRYLAENGYDIIVVSSDSHDTEYFCKQNQVKYVPIDIPRKASPITILKAIHRLCILIKAEKADAVFGHTPVGSLCAMLSATICRIKNRVYYRHGVIYTTMTGWHKFVFKQEERFVSLLATSIINVSHSLSLLAITDKLNSKEKQLVIGHGTCGGIDAQNLFNPNLLNAQNVFTIKNDLNLLKVDVVFGFCGRICNDKGIPELIDAFELFQKKNPNTTAKLLLIGQFDTRDKLSENKKYQINSNKNIIVSGFVDKRIIPYYYSLLDVFVFPSHREGFGMCVIEASAMEKPILDSRSHGCIDAIIEHVTGEYIQLTAESICQGMEMMMDVNLRTTLGRNGRKMVMTWYDYEIMWPLVGELYKRILK